MPAALYPGRIVLSLDFIMFCLRLMHIFTISKTLGPKIIIVKRMVRGADAAAGETCQGLSTPRGPHVPAVPLGSRLQAWPSHVFACMLPLPSSLP